MKEFKKVDFANEQEYLLAILEYVSEEGQGCFDDLSPDQQTWFNENVDLVTEGKELETLGIIEDTFPNEKEISEEDKNDFSSEEIPQEVTEEVPFGEDENDFSYENIMIDSNVELEIENDEIIIGKVTKVMKSAIKVNVNDEILRITKKKITKIISITDTVDTDTVDTDTVDTDTVDTDTVDTCKCNKVIVKQILSHMSEIMKLTSELI